MVAVLAVRRESPSCGIMVPNTEPQIRLRGRAFMSYGPVEFIVLKFPGRTIHPELLTSVEDMVHAGAVRIIDVLFFSNDAQGEIKVIEITELDDVVAAKMDPLAGELAGFLSEEDASEIAELLQPDSWAVLLLFENAWTSKFANAVQKADGTVLLSERLPRSVIDALVEEHDALIA
jgi:uncharacterized membrane protein